jgi:peptidoglycan hydrolase-like protein with peptidoglycan-binding domain
MQSLTLSITLGFLVLLAGCGWVHKETAPTPAPTPVSVAAPSVSSDTVRAVQQKLQDSGYYEDGPIDGVWGHYTKKAVEAFQSKNAIPVTGQLDGATLQSLNLTPSSSAVDSPAPVKQDN